MNEKDIAIPLPEDTERSGVRSPDKASDERSVESTDKASEASTDKASEASTDKASEASTDTVSEASTEKASEAPTEEDEVFTIDDVINKAGYGRFQRYLTFLSGMGWLADAFEIIILSIIGDMMACDWKMERWQNALLSSIVFAGMAVGAPSFGWFADKFGRRTALALSMLFMFIFGAATAVAPNYYWMIGLRAVMGFFLGGIAQGLTICTEYCPANIRGRAGFYLCYYWSVGCIGVILLAWAVMGVMDSWRFFVFLVAVPALLVFFTMKWFPESARYYLVNNQVDKAYRALERVARMNKVEMPKGRLSPKDATEQMGKMSDLLHPNIRRVSLLFCYMWLSSACAYYGIALITPVIVLNGHLFSQTNSTGSGFRAEVPCKKYSNQNFIDLLWTTAAELPGLVFFSLAIESFPRRLFLGIIAIVTSCLIPILLIQTKPVIILFLVLFVIRGLVAGIFQCLFIMTSESFPTTLRATAMGMGSGTARIGGLLIPFLSQVVVLAYPILSICVLAGLTFLCGVASLLLPMDHRATVLEDTVYGMRRKK